MIRDLDDTIRELLHTRAPAGSELAGATISFDVPDDAWRQKVTTLTVNCYLYDVRENRALRTQEGLIERSADGTRAARRAPPVRVDCAYCITAFSRHNAISVADEHRVLTQALVVLLKHPTIPTGVLQGGLTTQIPPYPTVIAQPDGVKNAPEFWRALDQQLKPSLNYVVTLAIRLDTPAPPLSRVVETVEVDPKHIAEFVV